MNDPRGWDLGRLISITPLIYSTLMLGQCTSIYSHIGLWTCKQCRVIVLGVHRGTSEMWNWSLILCSQVVTMGHNNGCHGDDCLSPIVVQCLVLHCEVFYNWTVLCRSISNNGIGCHGDSDCWWTVLWDSVPMAMVAGHSSLVVRWLCWGVYIFLLFGFGPLMLWAGARVLNQIKCK